MPVKKICCLGTGQAIIPVSGVIAIKCPEVRVTIVEANSKGSYMDPNQNPMAINTPGLAEILRKCQNKNLYFTSNKNSAINEADMIFIFNDSKLKKYGEGAGQTLDISSVDEEAYAIAENAESSKIVIESSHIPLRTAEYVKNILINNCKPNVECQVLSNPEFYEEGSSVQNLLFPEYILIGYDNTEKGLAAAKELMYVYERWVSPRNIILRSVWDAELAKMSALAAIAQRRANVYAMSAICEETNGNIAELAITMGKDSRIGSKLLGSSLSVGKYPKIIKNMVYMCESLGLLELADYWRQVLIMYDFHKEKYFAKLLWALNQTTVDRKIAVLGFAVHYNTTITEGSGAVDLCKKLLDEKAILNIFDVRITKAQILQDLENAGCSKLKENYEKYVNVFDDPYRATYQTQAIVVCTPSTNVSSLDFKRIFDEMVKPAYFFDSANVFNHTELLNIGYRVYAVGKYTKNV